MAMTQAERRVLGPVVRGEPYWGTCSGAWGQRDMGAAEDLQKAGLARIIMLNSHQGERRYVVIPPNCEWDFAGSSVRRPAATGSAA